MKNYGNWLKARTVNGITDLTDLDCKNFMRILSEFESLPRRSTLKLAEQQKSYIRLILNAIAGWESQHSVIINGVCRHLDNGNRENAAEWAGIRGIPWNRGEMSMTDDQAFEFRMRFE